MILMRCLKVRPTRGKKCRKLALIVSGLVLASLFAGAQAPAADLANNENLFFIKRNKNANEVHYDARVENCAWSQPDEVDYYWRDLEEGANVTNEIMFWEPPAYGFKTDRLSDSEITIRLNALPEKEVAARLSKTEDGGCNVSTTIEIRDKLAEISSVYVHAEEKTFLGVPYGATVHYILILGYSQDGQPVFERIIKSDQGAKLSSSPPDESHWQSGAATWGRP